LTDRFLKELFECSKRRRRDQKLAAGKGERTGVPNAQGCRVLGWEREAGTLGEKIKRELFLAAAGWGEAEADRRIKKTSSRHSLDFSHLR
jgi:hypothetical protein